MEQVKLVEKLKDKMKISYDEAKYTLENNNWDMLDAILYLEKNGIVEKPSISIFYTNEYKESHNDKMEIIKVIEDRESYKGKGKNDFGGIFEGICKAIDTCNNIFIEIKRRGETLLKVPLTVLIVLLFFVFWIIIPLILMALFVEIEFYISSKSVNTDKVNMVLSKISKNTEDIKAKFKKGINK